MHENQFVGRNHVFLWELTIHPFAELLPMMCNDWLRFLGQDIKVNGMRCPIVINDCGEILDGRNRVAACELAGIPMVEIRVVNLDGEALLQQILSWNASRSDIFQSQRAFAAAKFLEEAHSAAGPMTIFCGWTQNRAATEFNVSRRAVQDAVCVRLKGIQKLQSMVHSGDVGVSSAAAVARLSDEEQRKMVGGGRDSVIEYAAQLRRKGKVSATPSGEVGKANNGKMATADTQEPVNVQPPHGEEKYAGTIDGDKHENNHGREASHAALMAETEKLLALVTQFNAVMQLEELHASFCKLPENGQKDIVMQIASIFPVVAQ